MENKIDPNIYLHIKLSDGILLIYQDKYLLTNLSIKHGNIFNDVISIDGAYIPLNVYSIKLPELAVVTNDNNHVTTLEIYIDGRNENASKKYIKFAGDGIEYIKNNLLDIFKCFSNYFNKFNLYTDYNNYEFILYTHNNIIDF